jgi:Mn-containing catalase
MTNEQSGLSLIFNGESPFKDGQLETLDGIPEGGPIPNLPEAPQEFSPGLDQELKSKFQNLI